MKKSLVLVLTAIICSGGLSTTWAKPKISESKPIATTTGATSQVSPTSIQIDLSEKGLDIFTANKDYTLNIGGSIFSDWNFNVSADDDVKALINPGDSSNSFPKTRLELSGAIHNKVVYKLQFRYFRNTGAGEDDYALEDYYLGIVKLPYLGRIRVGQFKEPISLEALTSATETVFISSSNVGIFKPGRNVGLAMNTTMFNDHLTLAIGAFQENAADRDWTATRTNLTGRATVMLFHDPASHSFFHIGYGMSNRYPELGTSLAIINPAEMIKLMDIEAALSLGNLSFQAEYMTENDMIANTDNDPTFSAYTIQASYFLNNSHRAYIQKEGRYGAVVLNGQDDWEFVGRYSYLNLDDDNYPGTKQSTITLGTNWYIGKNAKLMLNYNLINIVDVGNASTAQSRIQFSF